MMTQQSRWDGKMILASALFCRLAFNLVFFVQELLLTLPKAFVPGVHVSLYHNNHNWTGDAPILPLLQGTGTVADLVMGVAFGVAQRQHGDAFHHHAPLIVLAGVPGTLSGASARS